MLWRVVLWADVLAPAVLLTAGWLNGKANCARVLAGAAGDSAKDAALVPGEDLQVDKSAKEVIRLRLGGARPPVAWPTVLLAISSVLLWAVTMYCGATGRWSHTVAVPVAIVAIFASFTPMHDAVHYSVAPKNRALNDLVGRVAGVPLSAPFAAFRVIHLMHHRWCNDAASGPGGFSLDPDSYGGHGTVFTLPLKWATNMFYYFFYVGRLTYYSAHGGSDVVPNNIVQYRTETLVTYALLQLAKLWAASQLGAAGVVVYWSLCKVAAALLLIYSFDFLPHRPHEVPYKQDPYVSTSVTKGLWEGQLTWLLLYQNYHNIHHIAPYLPFYTYSRVWFENKKELLALGTREIPLFSTVGLHWPKAHAS